MHDWVFSRSICISLWIRVHRLHFHYRRLSSRLIRYGSSNCTWKVGCAWLPLGNCTRWARLPTVLVMGNGPAFLWSNFFDGSLPLTLTSFTMLPKSSSRREDVRPDQIVLLLVDARNWSWSESIVNAGFVYCFSFNNRRTMHSLFFIQLKNILMCKKIHTILYPSNIPSIMCNTCCSKE